MLFSICKNTHFIWISEIYFQPLFEMGIWDCGAFLSRYPEGAAVAPPKNGILNPDIELAFRLKLRENKYNALSRTLHSVTLLHLGRANEFVLRSTYATFALLWIVPEATFYLWARTLQITQFIFFPGFDHLTHIGGAVVRFGIDSVKIPIILSIYLLVHMEDIALDALYRFFSIIHYECMNVGMC